MERFPVRTDRAFTLAFEIAKKLCENPNCHFSIDKDGATQLAEFIRTLEANFACNDETV